MSQMDEDVRQIAIRSQKLRQRVQNDVHEVCQILTKLNEKCKPRESEDLPESLKASLRRHFRDIYWSLKLHLVFHLDAESIADPELQNVGGLHMVALKDDEMDKLPGQNHATDPGSNLVEIVSIGTADIKSLSMRKSDRR